LFSTKTKKIAIHIDNEQINVGVANYKTNPYTIEYLTQLPLDSQELAKFVKDNKLKNLPAYLVLGGKQIVSRVITIFEIPKKEIGIPVKVADLQIEAFSLPEEIKKYIQQELPSFCLSCKLK